jgi:hypothetical protein
MILNLIQEYLRQKTAIVNSNLDTGIVLKQVVTELDLDLIGASESFIHYQTYITGIENIPGESSKYKNVDVTLEFIIQIANKNYTIYKKVFDKYVFAFMRILEHSKTPLMGFNDGNISTGIYLLDILDVKISNGDKFEDEYFKPQINFTLKINDSGVIDILKAEAV